MRYSMRTIWHARDLILRGFKVSEVAQKTGMTSSAIYSYTKSERERVKGVSSVKVISSK